MPSFLALHVTPILECSKTLEICTTRLEIQDILLKKLEMELRPELILDDKMSARAESSSWKSRYLAYRASFKRSFELWTNNDAGEGGESKDQEIRRKVDDEYEGLKAAIAKVEDETDGDELFKVITKVAERCVEILGKFSSRGRAE